ncbi:MAG: hydroxyacid dehydrogenase [Bacteroidetes bacterium]|jgi:D-3-phosphoglycerate dehydrogenase|nr:hydroxyacid dehydrogenase [Bacteroidota bacterium]
MRVLLIDSNHPVLHETLQLAGFTCDPYWDKSADELQKLLPQYDACVIRSKFKITKEIIDQCPNLKCIGRVGAGMENIDHVYAASKKIICVNAPEGNRDAVGEHALGMLLMLMNNLKKADAEVRNNIWLRAENRGYEITGKTVGIIGYGFMGSSFAQKLKGFDCNILAYDKYKTDISTDFVKQVELHELFNECDIVSLHVPLTPETEFMINSEFISKFKKPFYIINTARGKCLNTSDLVDAIKSGKVRGACLDVLEYESVSFSKTDLSKTPEPMQFLIKSDKVILSPHIAGWTHESNFKMSKIVAEKMVKVLSGI